MGMFKWLRKDFGQWDRNRRNLPSPEQNSLNNEKNKYWDALQAFLNRRRCPEVPSDSWNVSHNSDNKERVEASEMETTNNDHREENLNIDVLVIPHVSESDDDAASDAYRNALQAFLDRRRNPDVPGGFIVTPKSPTNKCVEIFKKKNSDKQDQKDVILGVPHVPAPEVFEIGWVAGTEDRYLELISAEWQHTRVTLRRNTQPGCYSAIREDLEILTKIRHPNNLLLMGTTQTEDHGLVAIFESVDCTLYNYIHEQGERISIQGVAKCAGQLAEALRHAHARGFIHGALSSHCVFLASSGTAKLGGWELAVHESNPKPYRDWEERLRSEIFRWQAPELFYGDGPTRRCDVYALTLLIWEMCTMRVPWSGLSEPEVERQYVHWERGVATDLYNFPPLLNNLLEAGLQLNINKRTLDMNRMRRFLQRLEIQYEEHDPIYVDQYANNNNPHVKTFNAPVCTSPIIISPVTPNHSETKHKPKASLAKKLFISEKTPCNQILAICPKKDNFPEAYDFYVDNETKRENSSGQGRKNTNMYVEAQKINSELFLNAQKKNLDKRQKRAGDIYPQIRRRRRSTERTYTIEEKMENMERYDSSTSVATTSTRTPTTSDDDGSLSDTLLDLKRLKETLASKRENFFFGNDSSQFDAPDISPGTRHRILTEARSKSCEPHKPASHKTSLEPSQSKSPSEYNPTSIKPTNYHNQRSPYSYMPTDVRQAIVQPQVLNPNSQSFFETSLWRKEKLICMSKMRRDNEDDSRNLTDVENGEQSEQRESPKSDSTYIINNNTTAGENTKVTLGDSAFMTDVTIDSQSTDYIPRSKSLQALKEALDRATSIIRPTTPITDESTQSSPVKNFNDSDITIDETGVNESLFEDLNKLRFSDDRRDGEIISIERISTEDSLFVTKTTKNEGENKKASKCKANMQNNSEDNDKSKCVSFDAPLNNFTCESIAETSQEHNTSNLDTVSDTYGNVPPKSSIGDSLIKMVDESTFDRTQNRNQNYAICQYERHESQNHPAETSLISTAMVFLSEKSQDKGCRSCLHKNVLARRRSLPAGLGHLRSFANSGGSPLGRLPIRRGEIPDSTVEDLYIDDEFGDSLNVNMVLLDENALPDDEDLLPDLLELSDI